MQWSYILRPLIQPEHSAFKLEAVFTMEWIYNVYWKAREGVDDCQS